MEESGSTSVRSSLAQSGRVAMEQGSGLVALPNELTVQVFSSLDTKDLLSVSQACKHWNHLSEDDSLWKPLYKQRWNGNNPKLNVFGASLIGSGYGSKKQLAVADDVKGWRSWKNKYITKLNWIDGHVMHKTSLPTGHDRPIASMDLSSEFYFTGSEDATIRITSVETGKGVDVLRGHSSTVTCLQQDEASGILVSAAKDGEVKIWRDRQCARTLKGHTAKVTALQFDTNNNKLITRGFDCLSNIWDLETGQLLSQRPTNSICTAFQFRKGQLVSGYLENQLKIWDLRSGQCARTFYGHTGAVTCVQFDDGVIVSGSTDKTSKTWDLRGGRLLSTQGNESTVTTLQFQGTKLVTGDSSKMIRVWNMKNRQQLYELDGAKSPVCKLRFDDKKVVCIGTTDKQLHVWNFAETMGY